MPKPLGSLQICPRVWGRAGHLHSDPELKPGDNRGAIRDAWGMQVPCRELADVGPWGLAAGGSWDAQKLLRWYWKAAIPRVLGVLSASGIHNILTRGVLTLQSHRGNR